MAKTGGPARIRGELEDAVCLLVLGGVPMRVIAEALDVCTLTVWRAVRRQFPDRPRQSKLSDADVVEIRRRMRAGEKTNALAAEYEVHPASISRRLGSVPRVRKTSKHAARSELRLSLEEREEISRGILAEESASAIARRLKRAPSTVSREIKRCGGRRAYRAWRADYRFVERCRRPKPRKLGTHEALCREVELGLMNYWSPEQIAGDLRERFPHDRSMQVSHETIYQSLYVQGRGALRVELKRHLRWKRLRRQMRKAGPQTRGQIRDMVNISSRPAEVEDRAIPGHWEGDLIIGRGGKSAIATLVERHSRYVMLAALPNGRTAEEVNDALAKLVQRLPATLRKSITWDQGRELARHAEFTVATGVQVYFCDPHSPWQRGSNENTNGLLRQFLPRTADLARKDQAELDQIAALLNGRPRQTLKWMKPSYVLNAAIGASIP